MLLKVVLHKYTNGRMYTLHDSIFLDFMIDSLNINAFFGL